MYELLNIDLISIVKTAGLLGLFFIIFAESGLFFGFFLPGDSLLFTAGLLASQGFLNIYFLIILMFLGATLGDTVGYWFGVKVGPKIFNRENSFLFNKKHIERTQNFYQKYGTKTIILARFIPIVRTFAPILAGVGGMKYSLFLRYNIVGGALWGIGITLLGFGLGNAVPNIDKYIISIVIIIIATSFIPIVIEFLKNEKLNE
ncbi:MAG: VTT domain-containing protein [Patescibacteria group bacterium]